MGQNNSSGSHSLQQSKDIQKQLSQRFIICPHPIYKKNEEFKLLHERFSNKKFLMRILTVGPMQKESVQKKILLRQSFKNSCITRLQHDIFEKIESYCGIQYKFYLIFGIENGSTLREEILLQGSSRPFFTEEEIIAGFENLKKGLLLIRSARQQHGNINTNNIYLINNKMVLSDSCLCMNSLQYPQKYPSPQKIDAINNKIESFDQYASDLFSISMCILETVPIVSLEKIYKRNGYLNTKQLSEEINKLKEYPTLKELLKKLLLDPQNLANRMEYIKSYHGIHHRHTSSDINQANHSATPKINIIKNPQIFGGSIKERNGQYEQNRPIENRKNKFENVSSASDKPFISIPQDIPPQSNNMPTRQTKSLLYIEQKRPLMQLFQQQQKLQYQPTQSQNNSIFSKTPIYSGQPTISFRIKPIQSNGNSQNQIKIPPQRPFGLNNQHIPHHLLNFNTNPYIPNQYRPPVEQDSQINRNPSKSQSQFSVKSQLIVCQPSRSYLNIDFNSPQQSNYQYAARQYENIPSKQVYSIIKQTSSISKKIDFGGQYDQDYNKKNKAIRYDNSKIVGSIFRMGEAATSFGLQSDRNKINTQYSFVLSSKNGDFSNEIYQEKLKLQKKENENDSQQYKHFDSLPLRLSMLVKDKVRDEQQQSIDINYPQRDVSYQSINFTSLKPPQSYFQSPFIYNHRTIPEEQHQEQQSFQGTIQKAEYIVETDKQGGRYQGFILNGMKNGYGSFFFAGGGYYQGQWKNNLMHGHGKLYQQKQQLLLVYEGQWYEDNFHGRGKVTNYQCTYFEGTINYENFEGAEQFWSTYDGFFNNDKKEGRGKWKFSNGDYYDGQFKEDLPHGNGGFYSKSIIVRGIWDNGQLIKRF